MILFDILFVIFSYFEINEISVFILQISTSISAAERAIVGNNGVKNAAAKSCEIVLIFMHFIKELICIKTYIECISKSIMFLIYQVEILLHRQSRENSRLCDQSALKVSI